MSAAPDPLDTAITRAAVRVLMRRAQQLRARAAFEVTTVADGHGRQVRISSPEAVVMLATADLFVDVAADLAAGGAA